MRYVKDYTEQLELFKALGSEIRIAILKLLLEHGRMSLNELAQALSITNGALTNHIHKLESCGLILVTADPAFHGNQKICEPILDRIYFIFSEENRPQNEWTARLRAGQYCAYEVFPSCGLSTAEHLIGDVDDPRYFSHQDHFEADILWFARGYVEYQIPTVIPHGNKIDQISISLELSSEAPGSNSNWPSDIHFYLNNTFIGMWTSPGDFADTRGIFTPEWWMPNWNHYGILKTILIDYDGVHIDGKKVSAVSIGQFHFDSMDQIRFKIAIPDSALHVGGVTIFGRGFGNYNQDIDFHIRYSPMHLES